MEQLEVYAALFCLEYQIKPSEIEMELRLYQADDIFNQQPDSGRHCADHGQNHSV